jgi:hypothetical protein
METEFIVLKVERALLGLRKDGPHGRFGTQLETLP